MRYFLLQSDDLLSKGTNIASKFIDLAIAYTPKILGAIIFFLIGNWIIGRLGILLRKTLTTRKFDHSLQSFLVSFFKITCQVLLVITIFGILGVNTSSFAALIVGAGIAIGSALNGTLGNFAGGVMMLIFKPFKIGDIIEAQGATGAVTDQGVFNTTLLTPDNKTVILPNGPLSTGVITNFNTHGNLRVDLSLAIALDVPVEKARTVAIEAMLKHPKVLKDPKPEVSVLKIGDGMTTLAIRPYTTQSDYWDVYFGVQESVKAAFDANDIAAPIPHRLIIQKQ
ncbi:mechanosensitive ion channel family protein [Agriterribacter sp.]|uniref:mechanosensitive ion channel family protein n=1 Tax=Agriterribacter sp. TaxID=2821509 RepID=UPI002B8CCC88|nr:mechanosensitive ion channel family protein [Agriterribacter sp.]HRO48024.1 mechanosensitive ion channel family protein [Agriterribacter sp.]HRQ15748.1 mechanosensitive ion channel family protein [Agriterribacter sp.]